MATSVKKVLLFSALVLATTAQAQKQPEKPAYPRTRYSEEVTFRNWVLVECIRLGSKPVATKKAAKAAAGEYLEQGNLQVNVYSGVTPLIQSFLDRRYQHIYSEDLTLMKCIDLFHSAELAKYFAEHKDDPSE